jgi:hypothetical protein
MESTLLEAIQRESAMTKDWYCKLMSEEEEYGTKIDLLDYVNLSKRKRKTRFPKNSSYPNFGLYKFPDTFNGLKDWPKIKKELHSSGIAGGWSMIPNDVKALACGKKYHVTCDCHDLPQ